MTKRRPKQPSNRHTPVLDWRELAQGPALRGLTEALTAPAKEQTPTEVLTPSGGDTPSGTGPPISILSLQPVSPTVGDHTTEVLNATAGEPFVGESPTAPESTTVGDSPTLVWSDSSGKLYGAARVRKVTSARETMTLGEERIYQALWLAKPEDGVPAEGESRTFTLGYDRLARVVRLNEKSVRTSLPKMIAKQIIEVLASEHSASQTGRTYRLFHEAEILRRQQAANLQYIIKNGRAVEFVRPAVGGEWPESTPEVVSPSVGVSPGILRALSEFGVPTAGTAQSIVLGCRRYDSQATEQEIIHFIYQQGQLLPPAVDVIAHLTILVPKCFQGGGVALWREQRKSAGA